MASKRKGVNKNRNGTAGSKAALQSARDAAMKLNGADRMEFMAWFTKWNDANTARTLLQISGSASKAGPAEWWAGRGLQLWPQEYSGENYDLFSIHVLRTYVQIPIVIGTLATVLRDRHNPDRNEESIANAICKNAGVLDELKNDDLVLDFRRGGLGRAGGTLEFV